MFKPTRTSSPLDLELGMEWYATDYPGTGGRLRVVVEDFIVHEVLLNGFVVGISGFLKEELGNYVWIEVEKRDVDTIAAARRIAKMLGVGLNKVSFGGLKDTRAIAYQLISVEGACVDPSKLQLGGKVRVLRTWRMSKHITPSDIYGNLFIVRVREVDRSIVVEMVDEILKLGTLAYYGYQRFGTIRPITHLIGKRMIKGDLEGAINYILCWTSPYEGDYVKRAREYACRGEYEKALEKMPRRYHEERALLKALIREPRNYANALRKLPIQLLRLFVEAYQSYLFNKLLSERVKEGLPIDRPTPGDLVALLDERGIPTFHVIKVNERLIEGLNARRFALVLPVVGYAVRLPDGKMGDVTLRVLKSEGVGLEDFRLKWYPQISPRGHYRLTITKPEDARCEVVDGDLVLSFRLRRGEYASMVLREIVKPRDPIGQGF